MLQVVISMALVPALSEAEADPAILAPFSQPQLPNFIDPASGRFSFSFNTQHPQPEAGEDGMEAETDRGITILTPLQDMSLDSSVASINDETIESIDVTDNDITIDDVEDDIEVLQVTSGVQTRSGRMFAVSNVKCQNCRQSNPKCFTPADGVGNEDVVNSPVVNIILDI